MQKLLFILLVILFCGLFATSIQAQEDKHTLYLYPLHSSFKSPYAKNFFNPMLGLGYAYQLNERLFVHTKFLFRQVDFKQRSDQFGIQTERNIKLGVQYRFINKRFQLLVNFLYFQEKRVKRISFLDFAERVYQLIQRKSNGFEIAPVLGFRLNKKIRLFYSPAFRLDYGNEKISYYKDYDSKDAFRQDHYSRMEPLLNPLESFGVGYTF